MLPLRRGQGSAGGYYSADYFVARSRFVTAARDRGFAHYSLPISAPGPQGEPLTIDVALAGPSTPRAAVLVTSGLHGVEGFFGSAVQLALLESLPRGWAPGPDRALILIHALNPFGFAWRRRFNEENVDLNRNFLLPREEYTGSPPLCGAIRQAMLRSARGRGPIGRGFDLTGTRMAVLAWKHGIDSLWQTLPVGQYDYPDWLFYGGCKRAQLAELLDAWLPPVLGGANEVVHLDFHTGLGRWSQCQLLVSETRESDQVEWWRRHFGNALVREPSPSGRSYQVRGGLGPWMRAQLPSSQYRFATAEFGTYSPLRVLSALVEELKCHFASELPAAEHWSRRRLADVFVPPHRTWRRTALARGVELIRRALEVSSAAGD